MFKIEKNVTMPERATSLNPCKYPFADMEVGDSFIIPDISTSAKAQSVYAAAKKYYGSAGHIAIRQTDRLESRIWRIK
jgi:hypothetical protein